jgi:acyl carrier protein
VEYFGRLDTQVKLRGYRIELGEVEAALARHPHVKEAAVTLHGDGQQEKRLLAFIVEREGCTVSSEQLRAHLHQTLPDYMLPGCFLKLDSLPATPAGKVDRVALSGREVTAQDGEAGEGESRTPMEDLLAGLCSELLGVGRVNIQSSFFNLGGNSLSAMRLISRIQQSLHVELALRRVFEVASLRELASDIEACQRNSCAAPRIAAAIRNHEMPASFAQQRLWFLDRLAPGTSLFNEFVAVRLRGDLDVAALAAALTELVKRHEVLRTVFRVREGRPVQIIHEWNEGGSLILKDLTDQGEEAQLDCLKALTAQESGAPFDLEAGPLLRMQLLRHTKDEYTLFFTAHHIVCDGWSVRVLARELSALYDAFSLAEPSPLEQPAYQYVDYAVWQRQWQQSESFAMQMDYWRRQLTPVPQFRLPATCSAASMTLVGAAASTGFGLSAEQAAKLYDLGRRED